MNLSSPLAATEAALAPRMTRRSFVGGAAAALTALASGSLLGCNAAGQDDSGQDDAPAPATPSEPVDGRPSPGQAAGSAPTSGDGSVAVVYFSMPLVESEDLDASSGASVVVRDDGTMVGNVQYVADYIAEMTGADLIRIEVQVDYPDTPDALIDYALEEQNRDDRPAIELVSDADGSAVESLDGYDTLFIGYPIWWYELPMCMYTFFETYDLAGKTVYPFVVHGGSGFLGTVQDIEGLQPDASVSEDGLSISRSRVAEAAEGEVSAWLTDLGLL